MKIIQYVAENVDSEYNLLYLRMYIRQMFSKRKQYIKNMNQVSLK